MLRIYGASDDLVEVEGSTSGEISCYGRDVAVRVGGVEHGKGCVLTWSYGKASPCWSVHVEQIDDDTDDGLAMPAISITSRSGSVVVDIAEALPCVRVVEGADVEIN